MALTKVSYSMIEGATANVLDFGADSTGVADSTAAIQAAIDSGAGSVYVPAGTYKVTSTININRPITFFGAGKASTVFSQSTNFDVFYVHDGLNTVMLNVNLNNFGITNTQARASVISGAGIKLYKTYFSQLSEIKIFNCYIGINSTQSNVTKYDSVDVTQFNYVGYCSIHLGSATCAHLFSQQYGRTNRER